MTVEVVIPWSGDCPDRRAALHWVLGMYRRQHPRWRITISHWSGPNWCKARAVMPAVEASVADVIVMADADVWCDGTRLAVRAVRAGAAWAIPHMLVHRLTPEATHVVLDGGEPDLTALVQRPYRGTPAGGLLVMRRDTFLDVPLDPRFIGWGQEDESHGIALQCLYGSPWRGGKPLVHLWHEPQHRDSRKVGSLTGARLRRRYALARTNPAAMRSILEEFRDAPDRPAEPAVHDRPAC